jgi:8-oxo-dGTP pyrophosphatase MutT (NUDIX family)
MLLLPSNLIEQLQVKVLQQLPGLAAQLKMAPPSRMPHQQNVPADARIGGVVVLLHQINAIWHVLLMRRSADGGTHSGQISLPGGKYETSDGSITYTALRETMEEIGIPFSDIKVLGKLTQLYIPPSNFLVTPILAHWHQKNKINPSLDEVQEVMHIPLHHLIDFRYQTTDVVLRSDDPTLQMTAPLYQFSETIKVWGATAMMLSELEALLRE